MGSCSCLWKTSLSMLSSEPCCTQRHTDDDLSSTSLDRPCPTDALVSSSPYTDRRTVLFRLRCWSLSSGDYDLCVMPRRPRYPNRIRQRTVEVDRGLAQAFHVSTSTLSHYLWRVGIRRPCPCLSDIFCCVYLMRSRMHARYGTHNKHGVHSSQPI